MSSRIDSARLGSVAINGKRYEHDVYIYANGKVEERSPQSGKTISTDEIRKLLKYGTPSVLIVTTGISGNTKVSKDIEKIARGLRVELVVEATPRAVFSFNAAQSQGRSVAAIVCVTD
nr:MTH938/NDUFAF3 family protein [Candidatus Njordarchaeum guaymaensis]